MLKQTGFVIAAATLGFAVAFPAFAGDAPVALIEGLTSQPVELMTYAHVGQVIHLSTDQTMVLSYKDTCIRETITGGTITIGMGQSEVKSGEVQRSKERRCDVGRIEQLKRSEDAGGRTFRGPH
jgi:hypothetical protein